MKRSFLVMVGFMGVVICGAARADDAEISYGGSPSARKGTGTVTMQSEVVILDIGPDNVKADCLFVFKNTGKACTVRMGFPDGDSQRDQAQDENSKEPIQSAFSSFKSFVDGRPVATSLVHGADYAWHEKLVSFPAHGVRRVREVYTVPVGSNAGGAKPFNTTYYVLQTGASWRGPIGRMEIIARFRRSKSAHPTKGHLFQEVRAVSHAALSEQGLYKAKWTRPDQEVVVYDGPGKPQVQHNVLRWVRTRIRPTAKDDIFLAFKMK